MLRLRDIMTREVLTLGPESTVRDAIALLAAHHVSGAPVVSGEKVIGIISSSDLLSFVAHAPALASGDHPGANDPTDLDRWEGGNAPVAFRKLWLRGEDGLLSETAAPPGPVDFDAHTVSHLMTRRVHSMASDAGVTWAADYMRRERIHRLLVMENDRLVGIVSLTDIVRAVADHRLMSQRYVFPKRSPAPSAVADRRRP